MMSTTGAFQVPSRAVSRATRPATWFAVAAAAVLAPLLVASALRPMAAMRASERRVGVVSWDAGAITGFGPLHSHLGRVRAEVLSHPDLLSGTIQSWTVRLTTPAGTGIDGSPVTVEAYMPETGERMDGVPRVSYIGGGRYRIDGLRFSRRGWWNVGLAVRFAFGGDSLAFNVILAR